MRTTDVLTLIPQRPPFVMIDHIVDADEEMAKSEFTVREDNIFNENGKLLEPALVENIAQTAAAHAGWLSVTNNRPVTIGYIGAIQNLEVSDLPVTGDLLETTIKVLNKVFDVTLISGELKTGGRVLASCEMKIFISKQV